NARAMARQYDLLREARAAEYASDCYNSTGLSYNNDCSYFYQPVIPCLKRKETWGCPFHDNDICAKDSMQVTFETEWVDASVVGINTPDAFSFRRKTTCAALNVDPPFVREVDTGGERAFYYYYGEKSSGGVVDTAYTYNSSGNPYKW